MVTRISLPMTEEQAQHLIDLSGYQQGFSQVIEGSCTHHLPGARSIEGTVWRLDRSDETFIQIIRMPDRLPYVCIGNIPNVRRARHYTRDLRAAGATDAPRLDDDRIVVSTNDELDAHDRISEVVGSLGGVYDSGRYWWYISSLELLERLLSE